MKRGEREQVSADCITTKWLPLKQRFLGNFCLLGQTIQAYISVILPYLQKLPLQGLSLVVWEWEAGWTI